MVLTGAPGSEIEIRLRKITGDEPAKTIYFDEYASAAKKSVDPPWFKDGYKQIKTTRHIIPEDARYAIEVTAKKGLVRGKYNDNSLAVKVTDLGSGINFIPTIWHDLNIGAGVLQNDVTFVLSHAEQAVVNGEVRQNVELSFQSLSLDENLDREIGRDGNHPERKSGIVVQISRYSKKTNNPRAEYTEEMARYEQQVARGSNTFTKSQVISEYDFSKKGISHEPGFAGGDISSRPLKKSSSLEATAEFRETRICTFLLHSADYLEHENFRKAPIPLEMYSWTALNYREKQQSFEKLQVRDREFVLQRQILEAGPGADLKAIRKTLFEGEFHPRRWLPWKEHTAEAREEIVKTLQERITWFESGVPPLDHSAKTPPVTKLPQLCKKQEQFQSVSIKKEKASTAISLDSDSEDELPLQIVRDNAAHWKPVVPPISKSGAAILLPTIRGKPINLALGDKHAPPSSNRRPAQNRTIKNEPIDLDTFVLLPPAKLTGGGSNTIKREGGTNNITGIKRNYEESHAEELEKLKEEDDDLRMDLEYLERIMETRRARKEKRARISALEASQHD